jgi:hypothetical protein
MARVTVNVSTEEHAAGEVVYTDATAVEDPATGGLAIMRGEHCLAEFPAGRFTSWAMSEEEEAAPAEEAAPEGDTERAPAQEGAPEGETPAGA